MPSKELIETPTPDESTDSIKASLRTFFDALLDSNNLYIATQATLDSLDIWISSIKYYFDVTNPASSNLSTLMMNDWLLTEEGFFTFFLGGALVSSFAFFGNYATSDEKSEFAKMADQYWPYMRDCFKGVKWTFKGIRSSILVSQILTHQDLIYLTTPIGVSLGLFAAVNRYFNRSIIEERKTTQDKNEFFRKQIKCIRSGFQVINPSILGHESDGKRFFVGSISRIKGQEKQEDYSYRWVDFDGHAKEIRFADLSESEKKFLIRLELHLDSYQPSRAARINWDDYQSVYEAHYRTFPRNSFIIKAYEAKKDYFKEITNLQGHFYQELNDIPAFQTAPHLGYITSLINGILNAPYYFLGALIMVALPQSVFVYGLAASIFFMVLNLVGEYYQEFEYQRRLKISEMKAKLAMNKRVMRICLDEVQRLFDETYSKKETGWVNWVNWFGGKKPRLPSTIVQEWIDKLEGNEKYAQWVILLKAYHEEGACDDIDFNALRGQENDLPFDEKEKNFILSLLNIQELKQTFVANRKTLQEMLVLDNKMTLIQGIKNGLHVYGAFNGLLMTLSTVSFLFGLTFPPSLFFISMVFGFSMLLFCIVYTLYLNSLKPDLTENNPNPIKDEVTEGFITSVLKAIIEDNSDIIPSPNPLISEQAEIFRQSVSGFKKGIKSTQVMQVLCSSWFDPEAPLVTKMIYMLVGVCYAPIFALKGYKGLRRIGDEEYVKASLFFGIYQDKGTKDSNHTQMDLDDDALVPSY